MRHARKVRHHRLAADVLTERQCQRRLQVVVRLRANDLSERYDLAFLIRDFQPHHVLARNDFHDANTQHRQGACQVFGQAGDLPGLHSGSGTQLEAGHHRSGLNGDDFGLDAKVLQFHFHQARQRFQRFRRIDRLTRRRIVEQAQRRQFARLGPIEQRNLSFLLNALALLDDGLGRLDARRCAGRRFLLLRFDRLLARLLALTTLGCILGGGQAHPQPADSTPGAGSQPIDDREPGNVKRQRKARHPGRDHQKGRAQEFKAVSQSATDQLADYPSGALAQDARRPMQGGEATAGEQHEHESRDSHRSVRARAAFPRRTPLKQPRPGPQHHGEKERRSSEDKEQHVRQPGADGPYPIVDPLRVAAI